MLKYCVDKKKKKDIEKAVDGIIRDKQIKQKEETGDTVS